MCWVMPPASPETTLVLRMASSSEVLPWSTWPMMVTTGGRGLRLPSSSPGGLSMITSSTSDSETRTTLWPNSSTMSVAVSGSMVWFWVAMMPFCISTFTTAATRSAMRLASSCTVMASGTLHLAHHLLALAGMALHAALLALLAPLHRGHGALAAFLVGGVGDGELARAAAVVLALGRGRASRRRRGPSRRRPSSGRSGGRPRRARPGPARRRGR